MPLEELEHLSNRDCLYFGEESTVTFEEKLASGESFPRYFQAVFLNTRGAFDVLKPPS